jgi:hypothetical protein
LHGSLAANILRTQEKLKALESIVNESFPNSNEAHYVSAALASIGSTERSLQTIIDGRTLNMKEEDQLREESQKNILYFSQFSSNLQSIIPRIGSMTIAEAGGGIAVSELFGEVLKGLPSYILPLVIALAAAIGYLLHAIDLLERRKLWRWEWTVIRTNLLSNSSPSLSHVWKKERRELIKRSQNEEILSCLESISGRHAKVVSIEYTQQNVAKQNGII